MKERFNRIYAQYKDDIYGYMVYMAKDRQLAEELTQETFLKIYLGLRRFKGDSSEKTWCLTIARNTFLSYARKKRPILLEEQTVEQMNEAHAESPEDYLLRKEKGERIRQVLMSLEEFDRTLILLRDYETLSYEEIASALDLTVASVKGKLFRAREKYKKKYERLTLSEEVE